MTNNDQSRSVEGVVATVHGHYQRQATGDVWTEVDTLRAENAALRTIISELGYCTPDASLEFMQLIPAEVKLALRSRSPLEDNE